MSRRAPKVKKPLRNYARHIVSGAETFFDGDQFYPKKPNEWAVWRPLTRLPELQRIGEYKWQYLLRRLHEVGEAKLQVGRVLQLLGEGDNRAYMMVEKLARKHLNLDNRGVLISEN